MKKRIFLLQKVVFSILFLGTLVVFSTGCDEDVIDVKIGVLSDMHYFDHSLIINDGTAFQNFVANERNLAKESVAIFNSAIEQIKNKNLDILLIPGDCVREGELVNHQKIVEELTKLEETGVKVYVAPGQHDINNFKAVAFDGDDTVAVDSISAEDFKTMYNQFGYSEAFNQDENSLSYVVEPVDGLWIVSLDACKYDENVAGAYSSVLGGALDEGTMTWLQAVLQEAKASGKRVFGLMHHGILEHYKDQKVFLGDMVIENNYEIADQIADNGLNILFSGSNHAQDISKRVSENNNFIFDIQTGSPLTYPCPFRTARLKDNRLSIRTHLVESIDYPLPEGENFRDYAYTFLHDGSMNEMTWLLPTGMLYIGGQQIQITENLPVISELLASSLLSYFIGDVVTDAETLEQINSLIESSDPSLSTLGTLMLNFRTDIAPADNNITIDLDTGKVIK